MIVESLDRAEPAESADLLVGRDRIHLRRCRSKAEIRRAVRDLLNLADLPREASSRILLKPNFNSDMCALTGNTTDLRIVAEVLRFLADRGYARLVVADGTSSGFVNTGIDVLERLGVVKLAKRWGAEVVDLNTSHAHTELLASEIPIRIPDAWREADFTINLPKIKTHAEARMSGCLKNMIGVVSGWDKQRIHDDLPRYIARLNEILRPDFHIVDGIVPMAGTGPSAGVPLRQDLLLGGRNPFVLDCVIARLMGSAPERVDYLRLAIAEGTIAARDLQDIAALPLDAWSVRFEEPSPGWLFRIVNDPRHRRFFVKVRYSRLAFRLLSSDRAGKVLYRLGMRQDYFDSRDPPAFRLVYDEGICVECGLCTDLCPADIEGPERMPGNEACIGCNYCHLACPTAALSLEAPSGFLKFQEERYGPRIRELFPVQ